VRFLKSGEYLSIFTEQLEWVVAELADKATTTSRAETEKEALASHATGARDFVANLTKFAGRKFTKAIQNNEDSRDLSTPRYVDDSQSF
jgi:hypothetical protein